MPVPRDPDALRRRLADLRAAPGTVVTSHPLAVVALAATAIQIYVGWRVHGAVPAGERLALRDSVIFEYVGWRLAAGDRLYVDVWEIKPPLSFEVTWLLAALSGGDVGLYHDLALVATGAAAAACAVLVAALVRETTGDDPAAIAGGLAVYALPAFAWRSTVGFKAKYFVVAAGLLALVLHLRERDLWSGVAAGAAVGFWQLGVGFALVVAGRLVQAGSMARVWRFLAGLAVAIAVVLAPVAWWGDLDAMIAETVLAPLLVGEQATAIDRFRLAVALLGPVGLVALAGVAGLAGALWPDVRGDQWWAPALGAWFFGQVLLLDLDAHPDLFPLMTVAALGTGLLLAGERPALPRPARWALAVALVVFVAVGAGTLGGYGDGGSPYTTPKTYEAPATLDPELPYNSTERQYVFWTARPPPSCRLFAGRTQVRLVETLGIGGEGVPYWETDCGRLGPTLDAVAERYG